MLHIDSLISDIRNAYLASGLTKAELAKRTGLHVNTLHAIEEREWSPRTPTIRALEKALIARKPKRKKRA